MDKFLTCLGSLTLSVKPGTNDIMKRLNNVYDVTTIS